MLKKLGDLFDILIVGTLIRCNFTTSYTTFFQCNNKAYKSYKTIRCQQLIESHYLSIKVFISYVMKQIGYFPTSASNNSGQNCCKNDEPKIRTSSQKPTQQFQNCYKVVYETNRTHYCPILHYETAKQNGYVTKNSFESVPNIKKNECSG